MVLGYTLAGAAVDVRHEQRHRRAGPGRVRDRGAAGGGGCPASPPVTSSRRSPSPSPAARARTRRACEPAPRSRTATPGLGARRPGKQFITNATEAGPVRGLRPHQAGRRKPAPGIAVFLLPADTPGITVGREGRQDGPGGLAHRRRHVLAGPRGSPEALVGGDGDVGYKAAMTSLARGRIHMAGLAVGAAQRALDESVALRRHRHAGRHARSGISSWCRRCSPISRPASSPGARWLARRPGCT